MFKYLLLIETRADSTRYFHSLDSFNLYHGKLCYLLWEVIETKRMREELSTNLIRSHYYGYTGCESKINQMNNQTTKGRREMEENFCL